LSSEEISGPSFGRGAWSFALGGLRPVGGRTTGWGAGIAACGAGGSIFASGAEQGVALAGGARPIVTVSPTAAVDATNTDMIRGIADNVTPFPSQDVTLTYVVGSCDDSDLRGSCDR
jgi:hypothetical protein